MKIFAWSASPSPSKPTIGSVAYEPEPNAKGERLIWVEEIWCSKLVSQESLFDGEPFPLLAAPQRARPAPRKREKIKPPSLQMDCPPTVADLLAGLGPTHQAAAERVRLSRLQATNICGRFGISRPVVRRVLELAKAA